jgi:hypothetical protein
MRSGVHDFGPHGPPRILESFEPLKPTQTKLSMKTHIQKLLLAFALCGAALTVQAQGTAFTYQGRLAENGVASSGINDLTFTLYTALTGGATVGVSNVVNDLAISNGLFTVTLDFGASAFDGNARWLQIAVRPGASTGAYTPLTPRQALNSTPYAVRAANFSGAVADNQLSANIAKLNAPAAFTAAVSFSNATGTFSGNGAGLMNINLPANSGGSMAAMGGFALASSPAVGLTPFALIAADVNGDGKPDFITANGGTNTLSVLTNNGIGGFALSASPEVGNLPYSVTAADVNGDGRVDLISASQDTNTLSVLTNNGRAGFVLFSSPEVDFGSYSVTSADVNGDGRPDLISSSYISNRVWVLTNNGNGSFPLASLPSVGAGPAGVASADVNGDGRPDLITANWDTNTLSLLINTGNGTFAPALTLVADAGPFSILAADVNGDAKVDLISANFYGGTLSYFTNNGSGAFTLALLVNVDSQSIALAAGDVNADGKMDLITASILTSRLTVLTNNGSGGFAVSPAGAVGKAPTAVRALDVNGDGKVDLITANGLDNTLSVLFNTAAFNGAFNGSFDGSFNGNGAGLTSLTASNLLGSVPVESLTSIPADNLVGQVPPGTLYFLPAENLVGAVPINTLTMVPADNLVGTVPAGVLGALPAPSLFGSVPSASLTTVPAGNLVGSVPAIVLTSVPAGALTGSVPSASLTSVPAGSLTGTIADARLSANVALRNANQTFTGNNTFSSSLLSSSGGGFAQPQLRVEQTTPGDYARLRLGTVGAPQWDVAVSPGPTPDLRFFNGSINQMVLSYGGTLTVLGGVAATGPENGVQGTTGNRFTSGVYGENSGEGYGVAGRTTGSGYAVYGDNADRGGYAGYFNGDVAVTGTLNPPSDRNVKRDFASVDSREVLEKVARLAIQTWAYTNSAGIRHIGPVAQDFKAAFDLGSSDKSIATVDADGVALAAIQGLNQKLEEILKAKDAELQALKERFSRLEAAFNKNIQTEK